MYWRTSFRPRTIACRHSAERFGPTSVSLDIGCRCGVRFAEKATWVEIGIDDDDAYLLVEGKKGLIVRLTETEDRFNLAQLATWLGHNLGLNTPRVTFRSDDGLVRNGEDLLLDLKFYEYEKDK